MKISFLFLLSLQFFFTPEILAQENICFVIPPAIKGTYTGACIKGKANGQGKSVGIDNYAGMFKNGYPHGYGKYIWQNENFYVGNFNKGNLEGNGEMHYKIASGTDSVLTGFWKNSKYIGLFENPWEVHTRTRRISKIEISASDKAGKSITVTIHQIQGQGLIRSSLVVTTINDIILAKGTYILKNEQNLSNGSITRFQNVLFPFRATFFLSNGEQTEMSFFEPADYDVTVDIL